jgi:hypothetical protein
MRLAQHLDTLLDCVVQTVVERLLRTPSKKQHLSLANATSIRRAEIHHASQRRSSAWIVGVRRVRL